MISEDDSKTTTKELESHEEATLPKEQTRSFPHGRLPAKLVPLRKGKTGGEILGARKKEFKVEKISTKKDNDGKYENSSFSSSSDRASRDYTNLRFQDPNFYETPKLLDAPNEPIVTVDHAGEKNGFKKELDLREVLKRSESLSPRYEKEWEQLSSKFGSEENIIDIDKLSINSLTKSEKFSDKPQQDLHPRQSNQTKELTLSGGGSMFLKSNRSRETIASIDDELQNDQFGVTPVEDKNTTSVGDRPKSILREKTSEDGEF